MKKFFLLIVFILNSIWCYNQSLTIQETIDYFNDIIKNQKGVDWISLPNKMLKSNIANQSCRGVYNYYLTLSDNGYVVIMRHFSLDMCKYAIDNGTQSEVERVRFHNSIVSIPSIIVNNYNRITFKGKNNDKIFGGVSNDYSFEFIEIEESYDLQRCLKAIKYLFTKLQSDKNYSA